MKISESLDVLMSNVMNIQCEMKDSEFKTLGDRLKYKTGHKDARHKAVELIAEFASRCRAQGGNTSNNITQAAANKAAEEGGLSDEQINAIADQVGMGTYSYECDPRAYGLRFARSIIAADRASQSVGLPTDNEEISIGSREFFDLLITLEKEPCVGNRLTIADFVDKHIDKLLIDRASRQVANKAEASVSTLDSLPDLMDEWVDAARRADALAVYAKIEALLDQHVAREVAAQAGQVAVPGGLHKASVGLIHALDVLPRDKDILWARIEKPLRAFRSALVELERAIPSPAKESK